MAAAFEVEPLLDSKRVVGTVLVPESLFAFTIPPDKVVRKGGYNSVDEAADDMLDRIKRLWIERNKPKVANEQETRNAGRRQGR